MFILLIIILVSIFGFGCYMVVNAEDLQKKLEIYKKLVDSVNERLDKHNL